MVNTEKTSTEQGRDSARLKSDEPWLVKITPGVTIAGIVVTIVIAAFGLPGPIDGLIWFYGRQIELPDATLKVAAGAAAGFLAIAALGRYELTRRQNHYAKEQTSHTREQVLIAERAQITDRFTRAIEQLGHDTITIRLGAIYALEHIAKDSSDIYGQTVIDVLCGYIREHRPLLTTETKDMLSAAPADEQVKSLLLTTDQQSVLTVIGRSHQYLQKPRIDLFEADLTRADLVGANLSEANLFGANLYSTVLSGADLVGANLTGADLSGADLVGANLSRAVLSEANLYSTVLSGANLSGADLTGANLSEATWDPKWPPLWPDGFSPLVNPLEW